MVTSIDELIAQGVMGCINRADAEDFCRAQDLQPSELCNRIALTVAKQFMAGLMSYEDADNVANEVWAMILRDAGDDIPFPEPAFSIFEAFDEGEYDHGHGEDPVEQYTKPRLAEILRDA